MTFLKPFVPKTRTVAITGALLEEIKALVPGQVYRLSGRDGRQYAVLDWDDFEHVMESAGMTCVERSDAQAR